MSTITDVAREAGVSVSTVSKVINNKGGVGDKTYARIAKAIEKLNYRPSVFAQSLKKNRTQLFGFVTPVLSGVYKDICDGIIKVLESKGYHLIIKTTFEFTDREKRALDELVTLGVQGIFIVGCFGENISLYDRVIDLKIPVLFIERTTEEREYPSVEFDNRETVYKIYEHLFSGKDAKPEEILLITGSQNFSSESECVKGAEAALRTFGFKDAPMVHAVSLVPEQSFRELTGFLPEIESSVSYIVLSNDIIFESVREVQKLFGFKEKNVYVMSGDHWFYYSRPEHSNFIMREATRCGRTSAKIMTEMLAAPSMFQNTHEIIETNIYAFEDKSKRSSAKGRKTLKILLYKSPISDPIIKLLKNFEIRSGIKVEYELFAGYEEMYNVLFENEGGYYKSADICMIDIPWINQAAEEGKALSLTQHLTNIEECFLPDVWRDFLAKDGQAYAIPIAYGTQILMYRKDLFEDPLLNQAFYKLFGVPLDVPKTWNEYNAVARFFTREYNPKSPVLYGNCLLGDNPVGLVEEFLARQWAFRGRFTKDDRIVINSVQNIQAVRNLRESYRYSRQDILKYQNDEHVMELTSGNVAMINVFNLSINGIFDEQFDKVRDKLGYATLPGRKSVYGAWGLAVCTDSPKKKEAFEFLKWYTSEQIAVLTNILSGFIPQKTVYHSEQTKNIFPWNENVPAFMETACMREEIRTKNNKIINEFRINKIIGDALASCLYEGVDEHDALTTAKDRIEYLVAERTE